LFLNTRDGEGELHSAIREADQGDSFGEWTEYRLKIPFYLYAREIRFGVFFYGKGTVCADDLQLLVDGKPIEKMPERRLMDYPALGDTAFAGESGIPIDSLSEVQIRDLAILGNIWGFVKYYHPASVGGKVNMDAELFRVMPLVLEAENAGERDRMLVDWLNRIGPASNQASSTFPDTATFRYRLLPDLNWMEDMKLGEGLRIRLREIFENPREVPHYYFSLNPGIGNPVFKHEDPYPEMHLPDEGYRILALFRYWNMVRYFYPYRDLIEEDWNGILREYILLFLSAGKPLEYRQAILHLSGRIRDSHAAIPGKDQLIENARGKFQAPLRIRFIENRAVVTGYSREALGKWSGLRPGDVILTVDGREISDLIRERQALYPASNRASRLRDMAADLLRGNNATVRVRFSRDGKEQEMTLGRYPLSQLDRSMDHAVNRYDSGYGFLEDSIGYISLGSIRNEMLEEIFNRFRNTKGIVIDIRNYPSEFVVFTLGRYLMPSPADFVRFTKPDMGWPGGFVWTDPPPVGEQNPKYFKGALALLVNEITQSQGEYTAMAFHKAPRAKLVGNPTAGANGNVTEMVLPGNAYTRISGIGVYYPDGTTPQQTGIMPDVLVHPTIRGIREGRDEILEKAVELIENGDI
jgi:hypothetical protein